MSPELDSSTRRIPSLVQYCQRVASAHVNSITSFGDGSDGLRYGLIKPILENCSPETLLRLESTSPFIKQDTLEIWKDKCFRTYPLVRERYLLHELEEPESWRDQFFVLREAEAKRIEEVGSRLRIRRDEAGERKKEREVKLTDRVPPTKRSRWSNNAQPKTLFQKTRSEASKIQKAIYTSRIIPPMPTGKQYKILPGAPSAKPLPLPTPSQRRVRVHTVTYRRPTSPPALSSSSSRSPSLDEPKPAKHAPLISVSSITSSDTFEARVPKPITPGKKDPISAMFVPAHHRHSQLPRRGLPSQAGKVPPSR